MFQKSQRRLVIASAVVTLALLGFFFVSGISRVHAQETAETISPKVESVASAINLGTLAISDEQGGNTSTPASGGSGGGSGSLSNNSGENNFATIGTGENNFTTNALGENTFTTATSTTVGENTFTTSATPTTGCVSNCGGGGGGGTSGGSSGGQVLGAFVAPPASCPLFLKEYIRLGRANNPVEVRKLQAFLDIFEGEHLVITGVYTQADFDAVSRFQAKYLRDVLGPWGIDGSTGYVFITTTFAINNIYCNRSTANDLNLRNFYPQVYATVTASASSLETGSASLASVATTTASTSSVNLSRNPNFFQAAATGLLDFFKLNPGSVLITLLILSILFMVFLIWRLSEYPDTPEPVLDYQLHPDVAEADFASEEAEVLVEDDFSPLDLTDEDPTQPTLDKL